MNSNREEKKMKVIKAHTMHFTAPNERERKYLNEILINEQDKNEIGYLKYFEVYPVTNN
jgi:hypothetical protein